jgi:hypothetical protein
MNDKLALILKLAGDAILLAGVPQAAIFLEIFKVSADAYQKISGEPVDPALIPPIERID